MMTIGFILVGDGGGTSSMPQRHVLDLPLAELGDTCYRP